MFDIVLIRHGVTEWNQKGLYQGHTDIPLLQSSYSELRSYKVPADWFKYKIISSPLIRAQETAQTLFSRVDFTEPRIIEMNMGQWEGQSVTEIKKDDDYTPPSYGWKGWKSGPLGGESYAEVRERVQEWLSALEGDTVAVTHKGVLLVAMAIAHDWDMASKRPFKLPSETAFVFSCEKGILKLKKTQLLK